MDPEDHSSTDGNNLRNDKKRQRMGLSPITGTATDMTEWHSPELSDILLSIERKLSLMDNRIALIELLHQEFQALHQSLEYSQAQVDELTQKNKKLEKNVKSLTTKLDAVAIENRKIKDTILDLQARSMTDNLVFSGIPKQHPDTEKFIKDFIHTTWHTHGYSE